ncbi:serine/threonine-protein kinase SBK1-like [Ambystoma mexicanum]|uniref:serine/threonine-protein kinase SBK1-like n=1 Tax=Ambystoma mexicanum TaxID=8296 RepID=UPI0037E9ACF1
MSAIELSLSTERALTDLLLLTTEHMVTMEIAEHFDVLRELGRGTYGKVVLGMHRGSDATVALKLLPKNHILWESFLLVFSTSLLLSAHPSIITTLIIAWQTVDHYILAQEVAPAGSLHSLLIPEVGIPEAMVKRCVLQVTSALDYMHGLGLVHRDVKPDNIMLMDPECRCLKLSDFGLTTMAGTSIPSMNCIIPYMAPELCCLRKPETLFLHHSLDVWALAVVMLTTLTGFFTWKQALPSDRHYKYFCWWHMSGYSSPVPGYWQRFTHEAVQGIKEMLSFHPLRRCSIKNIQQYLDVPWKAEDFVAVVSSESEVEEEELELQEHSSESKAEEEELDQQENSSESEVEEEELDQQEHSSESEAEEEELAPQEHSSESEVEEEELELQEHSSESEAEEEELLQLVHSSEGDVRAMEGEVGDEEEVVQEEDLVVEGVVIQPEEVVEHE